MNNDCSVGGRADRGRLARDDMLVGCNSIKGKVIEEYTLEAYRGPLLTSGTKGPHECEHIEG